MRCFSNDEIIIQRKNYLSLYVVLHKYTQHERTFTSEVLYTECFKNNIDGLD